MENKKGVTTVTLIAFVFISLLLVIALGVFSFVIGAVDDSFSSIDLNIGNQSFNDTYQELMHGGMETLEITVPRNVATGTLIGMVLIMILIGVKAPKKSNVWLILDVGIIIVAEIFAVVISSSFENSILHLTPEFFNIFSTTLAESSKWILNLPVIVPTVGALIMAATYILKKGLREDVGDFSQQEGEI